jgi:putative membrane protein
MIPPPVTARRTSLRIVLLHTATFRQARQFVPAVIPSSPPSGWAAER